MEQVFYSSNKFITNFHVINGLLQHVSKVEDITLSQEGNARTLKIKGIVALSALHDLALLETTQSVDHYLPNKEQLSSETRRCIYHRLSWWKAYRYKKNQ